MTRPKMFAIFIALSFGPSWLMAALFPGTFSDERARAMIVAYTLPLTIGTLLTQGPVIKQAILDPLALRFRTKRWWIAGWLLPLVVFGTALLLGSLTDESLFLSSADILAHKKAGLSGAALEAFDKTYKENGDPPAAWMLVLLALPAGLTINAFLAFGPELAFRGFLFREVPGNFWKRSTVIALMECLWLAPALMLGGIFGIKGWLPLAAYGFFALAFSPVTTYLRARSGSILPGVFFRGTTLALTPVASDVFFGTSILWRPMFGVYGSLGLASVLLLLALHDRLLAEKTLMFAPAPKGVKAKS